MRARIVHALEDHDNELKKDPARIKFLCTMNDQEEIITYNEILEYMQDDEANPTVWKFKKITAHEGPLIKTHPQYKGSFYNIMVEWDTGEITSEPLAIIAADDPVSCALYAKRNGLLSTPGWIRFKCLAKCEGKLLHMVNQAKLRSY